MDLDMKKVVCATVSPYPLSQHDGGPPRLILSQGGGPWFISLKPLVYSNKQNAFSSPVVLKLGPVRPHLVLRSQSYSLIRVHLEPPKGTQKVPGIHFENPSLYLQAKGG